MEEKKSHQNYVSILYTSMDIDFYFNEICVLHWIGEYIRLPS